MNKKAENFLKAQDKQLNNAIASRLTIENHKKYTELLLKKEVQKAIRGEEIPRE